MKKSNREHAIEVTAEQDHTITLITKVTQEEALALRNATEGILWFLLEHEGEPINPNARCFVPKGRSRPTSESGLGIFLDFNQALIDAIEGQDREEIYLDNFVERWDADEGDTIAGKKPIPMLEPRWKKPSKRKKKKRA